MLVGDWLGTTVDYSAAEDPVEMIVDRWAGDWIGMPVDMWAVENRVAVEVIVGKLVGDWVGDWVEMPVDTWAEENRVEVAADKAAEDQFEMIVDILGNMMVAD